MLSLLFWILSFSASASWMRPALGDESPKPATTITRGWATRDCGCESITYGEEATPYPVKKGDAVGETCALEGEKVACESTDGRQLLCPKECLTLKAQAPLTREEWKAAVETATQQFAGAEYSRRVPAPVLEAIRKKHPAWIPAFYHQTRQAAGPYLASLKLEDFYFEATLPVRAKNEPVSIVFFYEDLDHFLSREVRWSFWVAQTGEAIHNAIAPYKLFEEPTYRVPCLVPGGPKLEQILLYGHAADLGSVGGCCGPYSLDSLAEKGPVSVDQNDRARFEETVGYETCGKSTDARTGRYAPQNILSIAGVANIRKKEETVRREEARPETYEVIGKCANQSRVIVLGSKGDWHSVYCEGLLGWTHRINIRWPKGDPRSKAH
jgi:hypothetical protein